MTMVETQPGLGIDEHEPDPIGNLIIISGATASGKTTVTQRLIESSALPMERIVTMTTRDPRTKDEEGYDFVSKEKFENTPLVAPKKYGKNFYGTPTKKLRDIFFGTNLIWNIDLSQLSHLDTIFRDAFSPEEATKLLAHTTIIVVSAPSHFYVEHKKRFVERAGKESTSDFAKRIRADAASLRDIQAQHMPLITHTPQHLEDTLGRLKQEKAIHPLQPIVNVVINEEGKLAETVAVVRQIIQATESKGHTPPDQQAQ